MKRTAAQVAFPPRVPQSGEGHFKNVVKGGPGVETLLEPFSTTIFKYLAKPRGPEINNAHFIGEYVESFR